MMLSWATERLPPWLVPADVLGPDVTWQTKLKVSAAVAGGLGGLYYLYGMYRARDLPPGPRGWPLVGALGHVKEATFREDVMRLAKAHGEVVYLNMAGFQLILLNSPAAIKEALVTNSDTFAHRPDEVLYAEACGFENNLFLRPYASEGWAKERAFVVSCLRSAGVADRGRAAEMMTGEVDRLIAFMEPMIRDGTPLDLHTLLPKLTCNIITNIMFNKTYSYEDAMIDKYISGADGKMMAAKEAMGLMGWPTWLGRLVMRSLYKKVRALAMPLNDLAMVEVDAHTRSLDPANPEDFLDHFLSKKPGGATREEAVQMAAIIMPDGVTTAAAGLEWILAFLARYPSVQTRLQAEIDDVTTQAVTLSDRENMPYTDAVLREVTRLASPAGTTGPSILKDDVTFRGYRLPKGAMVISILFVAHLDPKVFDEPNKFKPERYLDADGKLNKTEVWMPFGQGRHRCLGEQIITTEMFLVAANLLQRYKVEFAPGHEPESMEARVIGVASYPLEHRVKLIPRE